MQFIDKINKNPHALFLLDGLGALLSIFLLGLILPLFQSTIGMPLTTLYFLAAIPVFFVIYDFYCYFKKVQPWQQYLYFIAIANVIYCIISIGMLAIHWQFLSAWGISYFIIEIIIVLSIALWELKFSKNLQ